MNSLVDDETAENCAEWVGDQIDRENDVIEWLDEVEFKWAVEEYEDVEEARDVKAGYEAVRWVVSHVLDELTFPCRQTGQDKDCQCVGEDTDECASECDDRDGFVATCHLINGIEAECWIC